MSVALTSGDTFAGYRIEEIAGRGPLGVVYRATQISLSRTVALRLVDGEAPADVRDRFLAAARVLAAIDHSHVVGVYEAGEAEGRLFVAMRWVPGTDLGALLGREGALAPARAARIVAQVADALDAAHARGLAHGAVKPTNVLLDEREAAYLTDFGVGSADARSDIRALGGVLGDAAAAPPPGLAEVVAGATADRYETAGELGRAALATIEEDATADLETTAPAPPRRRRALLFGALAVVAVLAVVVAVILLASGDEKPAARRASAPATGPLPASRPPTVEHIRLGAHVAPGDLAVDARYVYIVDRRSARLLFVDQSSGEVIHRVKIPGAANLTPDPYRPDRLWVTVPAGNRVVQVDTGRARLVGRPIHVSREPLLLAPTRTTVVVASQPEKGTLMRRFDKVSGRQVGKTLRDKGTPTDLDAYSGVAVTYWIQPAVIMFDERLEHPHTIVLKVPKGNGFFGRSANEMAIGPGGVAWILLNDSSPSRSDVVRVDLRTRKQLGKMLPIGPGLARELAIDHGSVWVPNLRVGTVARLDERSGRMVGKPIRVGAVQGNVAAVDGRAWVSGVHDLIRITP